MKRFFLLSILALLGMAVHAEGMHLVVWQTNQAGNGKQGCPAIFGWAADNNIGVAVDDHTRMPFTYAGEIETPGRATVEKFVLDINSAGGGLIVEAGDLFCLRDEDNDTWPHYGAATFPGYRGWFTDSEPDMQFGARTTVSAITVYRVKGEAKYAVIFNSDPAPEAPELPVTGEGTSPYVLQVWDYRTAQDEDAPRWDTSGGLFRVWEGLEGVKDGQRYPIDPKYLRSETIDNYTYKWLCFNKVDDIAAEESAAGHPLMWATSGYDSYQDIVGAGNGFERVSDDDSELYMIDFSVPGVNDGRGIYIEVPSLEDIKDGGWDTGNEDANSGVRRFFRGGIRFEFSDLREAFEGDNAWANSLRYVKWGHVFRLNEVARPLNAFPKFHATLRNEEPANGNPRVMIGWQDDFGPCEWNGYDYTPSTAPADADVDFYATGKQHYLGADEGDPAWVSTRAKKRGDSRLVSEYPFWLRKIYLQVVQDPEATLENGAPDTRYKRFYLSFEGEYDLSASITARAEWAYKAPDNANHVSTSPNIFRGSYVNFAEPAFSRFYNLDLKNITIGEYTDEDGNLYTDFLPLLGCRLEDYLTRIGHPDITKEEVLAGAEIPDAKRGHYLYMMEYHKGYDAHSLYSLRNAAGEALSYHDVPDERLGAEYEYTAREGSYFSAADGSEIDTEEGLVPDTKFVRTSEVSLFFDPQDARYTPTDVHAAYTFNFPNQIGTYHKEGTFPIDYADDDFSAPLEMEVTASWRDLEGTAFRSTLAWDGFESATPDADKGRAPVTTYAVSHAGSISSDYPGDDAFSVTVHGDVSLMASDNAYWLANPSHFGITNHFHSIETPESTYYMHYNLDAWYNLAYVQQGVYSRAAITDEEYSATEGAVPAAAVRAVETSAERDVATSRLTFRIRPRAMHAYGYAEFNDNTTAISGTAADTTEAPAEYYTLQGVRVAAPAPGTICIVRRGSAVTKELVR